MKKVKMLLIVVGSGIAMISCHDEKQTKAENLVVAYEQYVDSLNAVAAKDVKEDWDSIESTYQRKKIAAKNALQELKNRADFEDKIVVSSDKYELYKASYIAEHPEKTKISSIRKALFKSKDIGKDMTFSWVDKTNILSVYDHFVSTVSTNKTLYSREDWDEIKLLYEALDTRKNMIEKEGLLMSDNTKIAKLKIKFAFLYTLNRLEAKAEENAEVKE
jgi:hypothetical protein